MSWVLLATLSAACLGLYEVSKKAAVNGNAVLPVLLATNIAGTLVVLPLLVLSWYSPEAAGSLAVVPLSLGAHALILVKALIVTTSWVLGFFALKHLPISLASPIRASAPFLTLLGAVLLFAERPNLRQWCGIAIVLVAYWGFSVIGRVEGFGFATNRWVGLMVASTVVGAASGLYDKYLLAEQRLPPTTLQCWFTLYCTAIIGLVVLLFWALRRHESTAFEWRWTVLAVGVLLLLADNLYFRALSTEGALISVVSMIRRTNVVVSFALGSMAFRERLLRPKALALAGVVAGLWLLVG